MDGNVHNLIQSPWGYAYCEQHPHLIHGCLGPLHCPRSVAAIPDRLNLCTGHVRLLLSLMVDQGDRQGDNA